MKITIVSPLFPPEIGGPATYVVPLAKGLIQRGHEVKIITLAKEHPQEKFGLEVFSIIRDGEIMNELRILKAILTHSRDSDLIYALDVAAIGLQGVIAGKIMGKPVAIRYAGDTAWEKARRENKSEKEFEKFLKKPDANKWIIFLQNFVLHNADLVITPSKYLKRVVASCYGLSPKKITAINNAIEGNPNKAFKHNDLAIAYGRYVPWKRFDRIIQAFGDMPNCSLMIFGDGPLSEELKAQAQPFQNVIVAGSRENDVLLSTLAHSRMFILNSSYEGMAHSILEAFAAGVPVIASDIEPNRELITDGVNGLLIPTNPRFMNIFELRKAVEKLQDEGLREKLVNGGYEKLKEHTWEMNIQQTEEVFLWMMKK